MFSLTLRYRIPNIKERERNRTLLVAFFFSPVPLLLSPEVSFSVTKGAMNNTLGEEILPLIFF